jgi:hypothetical protein
MSTRRTAPPRRRTRPRRFPTAWLGGAVLLAAFTGLGFFLYATIQRRWSDFVEYLDPGNRFDLSYLPPNADLLIRLRPAEQHQADAVQSFLRTASYREALQPGWELLGLTAGQIQSATYAAVNFGRQLPEIQDGRARTPGFLTVVRTAAPLETLTFKPPLRFVDSLAHRDRSYTRITVDESPDQGPLAVYTPNGTTIILGTEEYVKAAIDGIVDGIPPPRREELDFVNPDQHLLLVALGSAGSEPEGGDNSLQRYPGPFRELVATMDRMPDAYALGLTFEEENVRIEALCRFGDAAAATVFERRMRETAAAARDQISTRQASEPGKAADSGSGSAWQLHAAADDALEQLSFTRREEITSVRTEVPLALLTRRGLLRVHVLAMAPFRLAEERVPRLLLGVPTVTAEP